CWRSSAASICWQRAIPIPRPACAWPHRWIRAPTAWPRPSCSCERCVRPRRQANRGGGRVLNRAANLAQVARALRDRSGEGGLLGVLVVRSQRVREVELTHGYAAAERLGEAMQAALAAALRSQDQVLRIGEQDFLALLSGLRSRQHAALAAAKALREPVMLDGWPVQPTVAVGVALAPDDGADPEMLCLRADQACD